MSGNACSHLDLAIPARDGYRLAATLFRPRWSTGAATAVKGLQRDYRLLD